MQHDLTVVKNFACKANVRVVYNNYLLVPGSTRVSLLLGHFMFDTIRLDETILTSCQTYDLVKK